MEFCEGATFPCYFEFVPSLFIYGNFHLAEKICPHFLKIEKQETILETPQFPKSYAVMSFLINNTLGIK